MTGAENLVPEGVLLRTQSMPVRWGDMDSLGHVNNIVYLQYFETIRLAWSESLGFLPLGQEDHGQVIVNTQAEFIRPVVYPATLELAMAGHSVGRSSFISTYTIAIDGELFTRGSAKIVWVNYAKSKSVPLPDIVLQALNAT